MILMEAVMPGGGGSNPATQMQTIMQTPPRTPQRQQQRYDEQQPGRTAEYNQDQQQQQQQQQEQLLAQDQAMPLENDRSKLVVLYHAATCPYDGIPGKTTESIGGGSGHDIDGASKTSLSLTGCPTHPHCCASKRLFGHMITCVKSDMCDVPGCQHARSVWKHYRKCPHRIHAQCGLCNAVPQAYNPKTLCERFRTSTSSRKHINSVSTTGSGTTNSRSNKTIPDSNALFSQQQRLLQSTANFVQKGYHEHQTKPDQMYSSKMFQLGTEYIPGDERIVGVWPMHDPGTIDGTPPRTATVIGVSPAFAAYNRPARIVTPDSTTDHDHNNAFGRESSNNNNHRYNSLSSTRTSTSLPPSSTAVWACGSAPDFLFQTNSLNNTNNNNTSNTVIGDPFDAKSQQQQPQQHQRSWRIQKSRASIASRGEYFAMDSRTALEDDEQQYNSQSSSSQGMQRGINFLSKMNPRASRRGVMANEDTQAVETGERHSDNGKSFPSNPQQQQRSSRIMRGTLRRFAA